MATLDHINLPDNLLEEISRRAKAQGISIEEQVVRDLTDAQRQLPVADEAVLMTEVRDERQKLADKGVFITDDLLSRGKSWGRK